MTRIITITNQKGGVGKTTTAAALVCGLSQRNARVLGVDLDPQGSLGFSLGLDIENCDTMYEVLKGQASIEDVIVSTPYGDLLPSNILLSAAELEFNRTGREFMLREHLRKIQHNYDYIIIDTPPALNVLTVNAYVAADSLIIPMVPEILSLLGVTQIKETIETVRKCYNEELEVLGILLNKFSKRFTLSQEVQEMAEQVAQQLGTHVFPTKIRSGVPAAAAPAHGESVLTFAPESGPAVDYQQLVNHIMYICPTERR